MAVSEVVGSFYVVLGVALLFVAILSHYTLQELHAMLLWGIGYTVVAVGAILLVPDEKL